MGKKMIGNGTYSARAYEQAAKLGAAVKTSRGKAGKARKMHRDDLVYWVADEKAVNEEKLTVTDPRNLNPFRDQCYGTIVDALYSKLKPAEVKTLTGTLSKDFARINKWSGTHNKEFDGVASTPWVSRLRLFEIACKRNPELFNSLKKRKSTRPGAKKSNLTPLEKFGENVKTIQRTGGVTPYALPLMRCLVAIDSRWIIFKGEPELEYRLVVGRAHPIKSKKTELKNVSLKKAG